MWVRFDQIFGTFLVWVRFYKNMGTLVRYILVWVRFDLNPYVELLCSNLNATPKPRVYLIYIVEKNSFKKPLSFYFLF